MLFLWISPNGQQMQFHFTNDGYRNSDRLIKLGPENYRIVSENEKLKLKRNKINFIDVTNQIPIESAIEQGLTLKPAPPSLWRKFQLMRSKQITTLKKKIPVYNYRNTLNMKKGEYFPIHKR